MNRQQSNSFGATLRQRAAAALAAALMLWLPVAAGAEVQQREGATEVTGMVTDQQKEPLMGN